MKKENAYKIKIGDSIITTSGQKKRVLRIIDDAVPKFVTISKTYTVDDVIAYEKKPIYGNESAPIINSKYNGYIQLNDIKALSELQI